MRNDHDNLIGDRKMDQHTYTIGQTVVIEKHGRYGTRLTTDTVKSIWKNGVIALRGTKDTYMPNGRRRGESYTSYYSTYYKIRPLKDGETAKQILADREALDKAASDEAEAKERKRNEDIDKWWEETGQAIWEARHTLPGTFMDEKVEIIRYMDSRHEESFLTSCIVLHYINKWNGRSQVSIQCGGMVGRTWEEEDGQTGSTISTFSSSTIRADSLKAALYELVTHK